jgi:hypothetical protein
MGYFGFQEGRFVFSFWLNKSSIHTVGISPAYVSVQRQFGFGTLDRKKAPLFADGLQPDAAHSFSWGHICIPTTAHSPILLLL